MTERLPELLLHVCCGPCAITTLADVQGKGFKTTGLFYNPNVHPLQEYLKRRNGAAQVAERTGIALRFCAPEYDPRVFLHTVQGQENDRCRHCYALRLKRVAQIAKQHGFTHFGTSLLYSKRQQHEEIIEAAQAAAKENRVEFYYQDLRPTWQEGIALSKQWGIYRQNYCGCIYSEAERYAGQLAEAQEGGSFLD
jgi:predicted adenine nucleotide alpha hydrolase (AANH) superfamily ATPase